MNVLGLDVKDQLRLQPQPSSLWNWFCCHLCEAPTKMPLCKNCMAELLKEHGKRCIRCAVSLPPGEVEECASCIAKPWPFASCTTLTDYRFPLDRLLLRMKFGQRPALARWLGKRLAEKWLQQSLFSHDRSQQSVLILPIPLSTQRLAERGFNQSWEMSRAIGKACLAAGVSVNARNDVLQRPRHTQMQSTLSDFASRKKNVSGAFSVVQPIANQHIWLVDDVFTTGCTASEAAKTLLKAGAHKIDLLVAFRTPALHAPAGGTTALANGQGGESRPM